MKQTQEPILQNLLLQNKRIVLIILFGIVYTYSITAQHLWQVYPAKVIKWNYVGGDEFNTGYVDEDKWLTFLPWSRAVLSQDIYYLDSNTSVQDGYIKFVIKQQSTPIALQSWELDTAYFKRNKIILEDGNKYPFKYTGGLIWSKEKFKYGYFEIKFKAPEGQGIWPAFWLYGGNPNNEIDFLELKGEKEKSIHVDIHCENGCSNYTTGWFGYRKAFGHWIKTRQKLKDGYNIISGEWTPSYIKWYLNGQLIALSEQSINIPMNLTAGTGIGKDNGFFDPGPDKDTKFPNDFSVDYIRVYRSDTLVNVRELAKMLSEVAPGTDSISEYTNAATSRVKYSSTPQNPITLSVMPQSAQMLLIRVLGMKKGDIVVIKISDIYGHLINQQTIRRNIEYPVNVTDINHIQIQAEVNKQKINESLNSQYEILSK